MESLKFRILNGFGRILSTTIERYQWQFMKIINALANINYYNILGILKELESIQYLPLMKLI
mgnify:CR=1 FL=1